MKSTSEKLQEIQQHGFHLESGTILNQAFENYKKVALTIGALILILILAFTLTVGSATALTLGITDLTQVVTNIDLTNYAVLIIILKFSVLAVSTAIIAPLSAGLLKMAHEAENNRPFGFSTAFSYYRSVYFKDLFMAVLFIAIFTNGIDLCVNFFNEYNDNKTTENILTFVFGLFNALIGVVTMFTIPLIIFGQLPAKEAIEGSITIVSKKFWLIVLLMLIGGFCSILFGLMAFCIGIFFTLPFMYSLQYTIYRNIIEIENAEEVL